MNISRVINPLYYAESIPLSIQLNSHLIVIIWKWDMADANNQVNLFDSEYYPESHLIRFFLLNNPIHMYTYVYLYKVDINNTIFLNSKSMSKFKSK